ncbi:tyrosine recombinase XerC [Kibdelosporangium aridum]|uniref:site-specific integrase n=1 Tax=Kibdelosporangium aridum TaxID=2030 RepID=UPI0021AD7B5E|nr:site-specific integrase [Kibdelosporangium aridum]
MRTLSDVRDCLRSALSDAVDAGVVSKNIAKSIKLPQRRKRRRPRWTTEEARKFLESARQDSDPLYAAYVLVIVMGMRRGEVLGLPLDAVDFTEHQLWVEHQLQRVRGQLLHRQTKTEASDDSLPMIAIVATALRLRLTKRQEDQLVATTEGSWQDSGLVFTTRYGTPIEPRNFLRSWNTRCRKAGVRRITLHAGRRTCGSLLADLDVHPRVAMRILRHAQMSVTMEIYTEVSDESVRQALKRLEQSLDG